MVKKRRSLNKSTEYSSLLPQVIDSTGNFLNNVKKPFFVWAVLALGVLAFALHLWTSRISGLYDVLKEQNSLSEKNNQLREQQNSLLKTIIQERCQIQDKKPLTKKLDVLPSINNLKGDSE